jgi:hypothetical protein
MVGEETPRRFLKHKALFDVLTTARQRTLLCHEYNSTPTTIIIFSSITSFYRVVFFYQIYRQTDMSFTRSVCLIVLILSTLMTFGGVHKRQRISRTLTTDCRFERQTERLLQCFSTAGPRPGTGAWRQLYRAARGKYFIMEIL